jgi:hypothetical protein
MAIYTGGACSMHKCEAINLICVSQLCYALWSFQDCRSLLARIFFSGWRAPTLSWSQFLLLLWRWCRRLNCPLLPLNCHYILLLMEASMHVNLICLRTMILLESWAFCKVETTTHAALEVSSLIIFHNARMPNIPLGPCSNKACCGGRDLFPWSILTITLLNQRPASGNCGYGATYCGKGCTSHCDAVAECGKDSKDGRTTCPLNTCCSQFGFCGTTSGILHSILA